MDNAPGAVRFIDLKAQYLSLKADIDQAVLRLLESTHYVLGPEVERLEREFAAYCQARHGIGVNSGTSALHLALLAAGVGPGDEVITVPFTFVATVAAIGYTGARAVLVDVDPVSLTMDPGRLERAITPRTRAVLPVHLHGQPADMDPILEVARRRSLVVIEDACQAHGAEYKGRRAGSLGDLACFSFYPGKNLGAYGEGGMVTTGSDGYARRIRMLRDWGAEKRYHHELKGYNYRLDGIQAAVLRVKLRHLEAWTRSRRAHAERYARGLAGGPVTPPTAMPYAGHVFHVYAVRTARREALREFLRQAGVETGIHYPIPVHLQEAYADLGGRPGDFPVSERLASEVLSLPMYAELPDADIDRVIDRVRSFP